jgi:hypothetical protein
MFDGTIGMPHGYRLRREAMPRYLAHVSGCDFARCASLDVAQKKIESGFDREPNQERTACLAGGGAF